MHRDWNVIPENLMQLTPREILNIEDKQSGCIGARLFKNQTAHAAYNALLLWFYSYGICHEIRSDGAGAFRDSFTK